MIFASVKELAFASDFWYLFFFLELFYSQPDLKGVRFWSADSTEMMSWKVSSCIFKFNLENFYLLISAGNYSFSNVPSSLEAVMESSITMRG